MAGIYGKVTEHPEFDVTDSRRFTVEILPHTFDPNGYCESCREGFQNGLHNATAAECEAQMRAQTDGQRGCESPGSHHPFVGTCICTFREKHPIHKEAAVAT